MDSGCIEENTLLMVRLRRQVKHFSEAIVTQIATATRARSKI